MREGFEMKKIDVLKFRSIAKKCCMIDDVCDRLANNDKRRINNERS